MYTSDNKLGEKEGRQEKVGMKNKERRKYREKNGSKDSRLKSRPTMCDLAFEIFHLDIQHL